MDIGNDPIREPDPIDIDRESSDVRDDLKALRADLEALAEDVAALGRTGIRQVRAGARDMARAGEEAVNDLDESLSQKVRERPIQSIAVAFLTGYIVSAIVR